MKKKLRPGMKYFATRSVGLKATNLTPATKRALAEIFVRDRKAISEAAFKQIDESSRSFAESFLGPAGYMEADEFIDELKKWVNHTRAFRNKIGDSERPLKVPKNLQHLWKRKGSIRLDTESSLRAGGLHTEQFGQILDSSILQGELLLLQLKDTEYRGAPAGKLWSVWVAVVAKILEREGLIGRLGVGKNVHRAKIAKFIKILQETCLPCECWQREEIGSIARGIGPVWTEFGSLEIGDLNLLLEYWGAGHYSQMIKLRDEASFNRLRHFLTETQPGTDTRKI